MSFEKLSDRLGSIPNLAPDLSRPPISVTPTAELVDHAMKNLDSILQNFGPLGQEERKAQLQAAITKGLIQKKMFQAAQMGDWDTFSVLSGHLTATDQAIKAQQLLALRIKNRKAYDDLGSDDDINFGTGTKLPPRTKAGQGSNDKVDLPPDASGGTTLPPPDLPALKPGASIRSPSGINGDGTDATTPTTQSFATPSDRLSGVVSGK